MSTRMSTRRPEQVQVQSPIQNRRKAFSLFEVMIAMAICVAGLALILQMLGTSETLSRRAQLHLKAQQHCRNLLNLYQAGILEPVDKRREELQADAQFWYSVKLQKHSMLALETIVVDVWPKSPREFGNSNIAAVEGDRGETNKFRLVGNRPLRSTSLEQKDSVPSNKLSPKPGAELKSGLRPNPASQQDRIPWFGGRGER